MSWRTARQALDVLVASGRSDVRLLFIGGEPLLEFDLIRQVVAHVRTRRFGVHLRITTNGTLIGPAEARFLAENDFRVDLSFDGIPEVQERRGRSTFTRLDQLLDRLRCDHRLFYEKRVGICMTLLPSTIQYLSRSIDYFLHKGVPRIEMAPAVTEEGEWQCERIAELEIEMRRVYSRSLEHWQATRNVPVRFLRSRRRHEATFEPASWLCGAGRGECLTVDVNGDTFGCVMFAGSYQRFPDTPLGRAMRGLGMGPVAAPSLGERLAAYEDVMRRMKIFDQRGAKYSSYGRCASCKHLETCFLCPMAIVHQRGNVDPHRIPGFTCAFNRLASEYATKFGEELTKAVGSVRL